MIKVNMLVAEAASSVPYTEQQLNVVIVLCILIGMFFGAVTADVLRKKNNVKH